MAGDEVTGVSIIRLVEALDAGPVCLRGETPIGLHDDYGTQAHRAGVERLDEPDDRDAGDLVAGHDRPLDRRGSSDGWTVRIS